MHIGKQIKLMRSKFQQTQAEFSKNVGVTMKTLSAYETERAKPPLNVMEQIADYCNISLDYLARAKEHGGKKGPVGDKQLAQLFERADKLPKKDREKIKSTLSALLN